jgi:ankyrin repeat protein
VQRLADADVNAKNTDGKTPLDRAVDETRCNGKGIVDFLLQHGGKTGNELDAEKKSSAP